LVLPFNGGQDMTPPYRFYLHGENCYLQENTESITIPMPSDNDVPAYDF
jgi:hypothetical protein